MRHTNSMYGCHRKNERNVEVFDFLSKKIAKSAYCFIIIIPLYITRLYNTTIFDKKQIFFWTKCKNNKILQIEKLKEPR